MDARQHHGHFLRSLCLDDFLMNVEVDYTKLHFIDMQRHFDVNEHWGKYYHPYLYIDDDKYWTMGAPFEETIVINRAKAI